MYLFKVGLQPVMKHQVEKVLLKLLHQVEPVGAANYQSALLADKANNNNKV